MSTLAETLPFPIATAEIKVAEPTYRRVFVSDLVLAASIGVYPHERENRQRIRVNVDLSVLEDGRPLGDDIARVVCYERIVTGIRDLVGAGHVNLVETLAEDIATLCLTDARVRSTLVRVEKLDIFPDAGAVGVEIERMAQNLSPSPSD